MAYQNVGTPRFWINTTEWLIKNKAATTIDINGNPIQISDPYGVLNTLPVTPIGLDVLLATFYANDIAIDVPTGVFNKNSFMAVLGHNYTTNGGGYLIFADDYEVGASWVNEIDTSGYFNSGDGSYNPPYNGFTIYTFDSTDKEIIGYHSTNNTLSAVGSIVIGTYYDIPHSPELKLTMTREMDGAKKIRTKGGADLVDHRYTKPPLWNDAAPWELYQGTPANQELSRSGRRSWDLRFNYLQASDMLGLNQTQSTANSGTDHHGDLFRGSDYDDGDINMHSDPDGTGTDTHGNFNYNLLTDDNFYSQVIHKTNGGQLPFLFQPDNSNPDGFAIAKFDMNKFSFRQTAPNMYSVKLKIREIW